MTCRMLLITHTTCFTKGGYWTKYCWLILHLTLRESTPKIILVFQIGLRMKIVSNNKNALPLWKDVSTHTVWSPLLRWHWATWPVLALTQLLQSPTYSSTNSTWSHLFLSSTKFQTLGCVNFWPPCIMYANTVILCITSTKIFQ